MRLFFFDTETTGLYIKGAPLRAQPFLVEFGGISYDIKPSGEMVLSEKIHFYVKPPIKIPQDASRIHGINDATVAKSKDFAYHSISILTNLFLADLIIGHNISYDMNVLYFELLRIGKDKGFTDLKDSCYCTMKNSTDVVQIKNQYGKNKWPKLTELHKFLFGCDFDGAHSALSDIEATARCFIELMEKKYCTPPASLPSSIFFNAERTGTQAKKGISNKRGRH